MWYFTWILGVLLAVALGVVNVMWLESEYCLGRPDCQD
jgi:cyd operon protein YbgT